MTNPIKAIFNVKEVQTENTNLKSQLAEKELAITTLQAQVDAKEKAVKETMDQAKADTEAFTTAKETLIKDYEAKIEALTKEKETISTSVNKEVASKVASIGIPVETIKEETTGALTIDDARKQLASLKGPAAQNFYKQNKGLFETYIKSPSNR